ARSLGVSALEVTAVERDVRSLHIFRALAEQAHERGLAPEIRLDTRALDLRRTRVASLPKADLILLGLALNELFPSDVVDSAVDSEERLDPAERFLRQCLGRLLPGGRLIVIEPALRSTSRFLQRLRGRLSDRVVAPCLRAGPCPLLRRERDWCHASMAFHLPTPLAETAKAAGLRTGRLTYAYLTLAADGTRLPGFGDERALRLVGGPVRSKGKTEWDGCGEAGLVRLRLLDRERGPSNATLHDAPRGARIRLPHAPSDGGSLRLRPALEIERI
ncbi:MAG TPA: hypothetical protein ENK57_18050, partial [Polyangiaceae bacterium]|nr:hypothetical protein [Polyangiaceae bacterium]